MHISRETYLKVEAAARSRIAAQRKGWRQQRAGFLSYQKRQLLRDLRSELYGTWGAKALKVDDSAAGRLRSKLSKW